MMENRNNDDTEGGKQANDSPETLTSDTAVERNPDVSKIIEENKDTDPGPRQNKAEKATEQATKEQEKRVEKERKEQEKADEKARKEQEKSSDRARRDEEMSQREFRENNKPYRMRNDK